MFGALLPRRAGTPAIPLTTKLKPSDQPNKQAASTAQQAATRDASRSGVSHRWWTLDSLGVQPDRPFVQVSNFSWTCRFVSLVSCRFRFAPFRSAPFRFVPLCSSPLLFCGGETHQLGFRHAGKPFGDGGEAGSRGRYVQVQPLGKVLRRPRVPAAGGLEGALRAPLRPGLPKG